MELSLILSDETETYQAILGQFIESSAAETRADRILAQQAAETATNSANSALDSAGKAAQSAAASADSAANAAASAAAASTSEQHASQYAAAAQSASTDAASSASGAAGSASAAALSATNAANSATSASVSEQNAAATLASALKKANNLSDVADAVAALANLGGAPKANPTFTGNVGVPTRTEGDSTDNAASTKFVSGAVNSLAKGRLLNVRFFNASATYTPTAGTGGALVFGWAAGGGGGGTGTGPSGTGNSQNIAPAGNSGAGAIWWWPNPTAQTVTVGAGGAAGTPSVNGGQGGNSSIGSLLVIPGGKGGVSTGTVGNAASNSATVQGDMPVITAGTLLFQRATEMGDHGIFALAPYNPRGGAGMFSGRPPFAMSPGSGWGAGHGPGMGGDGAFCNNYGQQSNGSAGANGQFIIFEFA
ncbi:hypothetical protein LGN04_05325 [Burkholderia multivorans]|uniref:hypothetical protein n=1 Tax=Burkholderia multivorans TaxID=87883 RepID=UPI0020197318|nr:hypothetical protein [Burkholderia multivorans]MCA8453327.1 hypothetical protein [Burkholderia multivorans]MCA8484979.1 hypothetical protein [Burkholderia multivorans]MCL4661972.1 hypothetical protein [Burkholderia multivorans]MCO1353405.1 hypothetical protein [Burkholderia multivorans]MCO1412751.1 hypothetical protein [Burkholderia multivorans]